MKLENFAKTIIIERAPVTRLMITRFFITIEINPWEPRVSTRTGLVANCSKAFPKNVPKNTVIPKKKIYMNRKIGWDCVRNEVIIVLIINPMNRKKNPFCIPSDPNVERESIAEVPSAVELSPLVSRPVAIVGITNERTKNPIAKVKITTTKINKSGRSPFLDNKFFSLFPPLFL